MIDSLAEGKGIMFYINGDRYEGDFKNDKPDGKGIYYFKNGDREMEIIPKERKLISTPKWILMVPLHH